MTLMRDEALQAPQAVARFLDQNGTALTDLGRRLRAAPPPAILTNARGSSDHAATYFKYLAEILLGLPVASVGASVVSVYGAQLHVPGGLCLTISQSGQSPDILALQAAARAGGALAVALINAPDTPAARDSDLCLPLMAGPELSVAATKSQIVSMVAGAAVVAHWAGDAALLAAIARLPDTLARAGAQDWSALPRHLEQAASVYVLGRGPSLAIAAETALKLKETCGIHAEPHSLAEVMHGPLEIVRDGFGVLAFVPPDAAAPASAQAIVRLRAAGAQVVVAGEGGLPFAATGHPLLDPVSMMLSAYLAIDTLARLRGRDPDRPAHLAKVTRTV
ncbi:MAG TPA: SIS domain-containing protein [Paracoccaceae bacterium]|nr:SIS domain-containing protein [Paracoccaceae bacterium]